jgi:hypothetical protein
MLGGEGEVVETGGQRRGERGGRGNLWHVTHIVPLVL